MHGPTRSEISRPESRGGNGRRAWLLLWALVLGLLTVPLSGRALSEVLEDGLALEGEQVPSVIREASCGPCALVHAAELGCEHAPTWTLPGSQVEPAEVESVETGEDEVRCWLEPTSLWIADAREIQGTLPCTRTPPPRGLARTDVARGPPARA